MKIVGISHPVAAPTPEGVKENVAAAKAWVRWIYTHYPDVMVECSWIVNAEVMDDFDPIERGRGLRRARIGAALCNELWLFGPHISEGMRGDMEATWDAGGVGKDFTAIEGFAPNDGHRFARTILPPCWYEYYNRDPGEF